MRSQFHTAPEDQGQIVTVSYAMVDGTVLRHTYDASDREERFARSQALAADQGDYWDGAPKNRRWKTITRAEFDRLCHPDED